MELTAGYPFWLIKDGLPFTYQKLRQATTADVIVIGGGISGALAAYYLTEAGIETVLVDARTIGLGSTSASTALLQYELDIPLHLLIKSIGQANAEKAYQYCGASIGKLISIMDRIGFKEYERRKSLFFTARRSEKKFMERELAARKNAGFEVESISGESLLNQYGLKAASGIISSLGACLNAYAFTHSLLQYSQQKGLKVFDRTRISKIKYEKETVLTTENGMTIRANKIINASGYEVVEFIQKKIVDFYCTYAIISENLEVEPDIWKDRLMMWNTEDPYNYFRLTQDNRIIVGGRDERFSNLVTRELFLEKKARALERDVQHYLPRVPFKREFAWSGTFGRTKDALPYIGPYPKTPNTYYALGFGGNGITFSQVAAEMITDMILGKENPDTAIFSFNR